MMMQLLKIIFVIAVFSFIGPSCIKQVDVALRNAPPILVVEGNITTDSVPYTVKLTYSGPIAYSDTIPDQYLEKDARVTIADELGNVTPLTYTTQGVYTTTDANYIGKTGRSYSVTVVLKDGKKYISVPEKIKPAVAISAVNATFVNQFDMFYPTYINISVDTKDPAADENYYRWNFMAYSGRQTRGVSCGINCIMNEYCYQKNADKEVRILSDAAINGNDIRDQTVGRCYVYTYLNDFVDVSQLSMTREAYQFWQHYQDQQIRTGGILDPLPASIRGNVYNAANTGDIALGYFSASSVTHRKFILVPYSITPYLLQISALQFIPEKYISCFDYYSNALSYPPDHQYPPPTGWENAEEIKVYW
jgi:hypothetical protein